MNWRLRLARWLEGESRTFSEPAPECLAPELYQQVVQIAAELDLSPRAVIHMYVQMMVAEYQAQVQQWHSLTEREKEVTRLVCQGLTDDEIAEVLKVTYHTVRTHLRKILLKFGLNSKNALRYYFRYWSF
jgi:DNA-binding CsgD family transcriptional regulator